MRLLQWALLLVPCLAMELLACLVAPFLVVLAIRRGRAPWWLSWFETPDNPIFGDPDHGQRWPRLPRSLRAIAWLWRNKAYTFRSHVLGARISGPVVLVGDPATGDRPLTEGWCLRLTPEGYWHLYLVRRWGLGFFLRVNLGWKLEAGPGHPNFGQYVVAVHPFRRVRWPSGVRAAARSGWPLRSRSTS